MIFLNINTLVLILTTILIGNNIIVEGNGIFDKLKLPNLWDLITGKIDVGDDKISLLDHFLLDILPLYIKQKPANQNGTKIFFKKYALEDESNDDAYRMTAHELIERSGFRYQTYDCLADDGYITVMTRLINPLADRKKLRWPPVLMMHGGTIDISAYLIASSIQHHPEPWPRTVTDGPITSWNRSLAFVLVNNGFDVWLAETRGSSDTNTRHVKTKALENALSGGNAGKNMTTGESMTELLKQWDYWSFTQDDIIAHEVKAQIDLVLKETGSDKLSLFTYSLSTPISFGFLSIRPDYGDKIHGFVSMAPIVSGHDYNTLLKFLFKFMCPLVPDSLGKFMLRVMMNQSMRDLMVFIAKSRKIRYSFMKMVINFMLGPSAQYETLLEVNVIGHLFRRLSFGETKQLCQQMKYNRLQKFDYGIIKNKLIYNQTEPPVYDLSNLNIKNWIIVMAENDALSTLAVMDHLIKIVNPKPVAKVIAPNLSHIDLFAGVENDRYVNFPILKYLESVSTTGIDNDFMAGSESTVSARQLDLKTFIPPELTESTKQITKAFVNITQNINPAEMFDNLQKSWTKMISNFDFKKLGEITKLDEFGKYLPKFPNLRKTFDEDSGEYQ